MRRGVLLVAGLAAIAAAQADVSKQRASVLDNLLLHDCGSCHGLTLRGGLGPALTADMMQARPAQALVAAIRDGIPGSAMPPWGELLAEEDIDYLVRRLREEVKP